MAFIPILRIITRTRLTLKQAKQGASGASGRAHFGDLIGLFDACVLVGRGKGLVGLVAYYSRSLRIVFPFFTFSSSIIIVVVTTNSFV